MKGEHGKRLDERDRRSLVLWAADCAEHVLPHFEEKRPDDGRPRKALEAGRAWVRAAAFAAHAAARDAGHAAARAAARAAGHARHAPSYAVTAATHAVVPGDAATATAAERDWQYRCLPEHLRPVAFPGKLTRRRSSS
jgi:hypothetical protein